MPTAIEKLRAAQQRTGSVLCVGLEPSDEYLPREFPRNLEGHEQFLRAILEATAGIACAYKVNLAFFESLGWEGMELLYCLREVIPDSALLVADAKRCDIGTSAKHYAVATFERLRADAITVNPLMGGDSVAPFLAYEDKLTFLLALTSNRGAADFLLPNDLYLRIARKAAEWNTAGNVGLVTGATHPEHLGALRAEVPSIPFLVPGVGAQGGDLEAALGHARSASNPPGVLLHATRAILPEPDEPDVVGSIRRRAQVLADRAAAALAG